MRAPSVGPRRSSMTRVLGHIHTHNESAVIDRTLAALRGQSHPVDGVLLVDNASTDGTLDREFPSDVRVVRFDENRMTSDPIIEAMRHADDEGYDWVWVLNGDTAPRADALEKLLAFYEGLDPATRESTWLLAALPVDMATGRADHGFLVTSRGLRRLDGDVPYECDATIWSGSLYRVSAIRTVGMPRSDYAMDIAEIEYGYRGRRHGFRAFMHPGAIAEHNVGGASLTVETRSIGRLRLQLIELKPFRCYYVIRNHLHFWLFVFAEKTPITYLYCFGKAAKLTANFAIRPWSRRRQLGACLRGFADGVRQRLDYRYPV